MGYWLLLLDLAYNIACCLALTQEIQPGETDSQHAVLPLELSSQPFGIAVAYSLFSKHRAPAVDQLSFVLGTV